MKLVSTTLEGVEEFLATGHNGLGAGDVVTGDEETDEEADGECEEMGHGFGMTSTRTRGPRSAGVCGVSKP